MMVCRTGDVVMRAHAKDSPKKTEWMEPQMEETLSHDGSYKHHGRLRIKVKCVSAGTLTLKHVLSGWVSMETVPGKLKLRCNDLASFTRRAKVVQEYV